MLLKEGKEGGRGWVCGRVQPKIYSFKYLYFACCQKYIPPHPQIFVFCVLTNESILREAGYRWVCAFITPPLIRPLCRCCNTALMLIQQTPLCRPLQLLIYSTLDETLLQSFTLGLHYCVETRTRAESILTVVWTALNLYSNEPKALYFVLRS